MDGCKNSTPPASVAARLETRLSATMPIPDRDIASPSPSVGGSTVSNEENGPAEADSPELKRLHAVGDTFRQILSDPIVADQYMKWFRDQCAAYQLPPAPAGVESCEAACKSLSLPRTIIEVPETYYVRFLRNIILLLLLIFYVPIRKVLRRYVPSVYPSSPQVRSKVPSQRSRS